MQGITVPNNFDRGVFKLKVLSFFVLVTVDVYVPDVLTGLGSLSGLS